MSPATPWHCPASPAHRTTVGPQFLQGCKWYDHCDSHVQWSYPNQGGGQRQSLGGRPCFSLLETSSKMVAPTPGHAPASHTYATSAVPNPREATMPRTLERLGAHPYATRCPRTGAGACLFLCRTLSSKGPASAEPSWGRGAALNRS